LYFLYRRKRNIRRKRDGDLDQMQLNCLIAAETEVEEFLPKRKKQRKSNRNINLMRSTDGTFQEVEPRHSTWYITYVVSPRIDDKKFNAKFRRRFRCNFQCYSSILEMVIAEPMFLRWQNNNATGKLSSPIEICVLGSLRYLGRGCTFDDLEESTSVSEESHRQFFHCFIYWGSTVLYEKFVRFPKTASQCKDSNEIMAAAGFHGCVGSTDATHVTMMRCPVSRANEHRGPKESLPARTYNLTVNHRRQILNTTKGHPCRWNDKTLSHYDEFIKFIKDGKILDDNHFSLFERDENDTIVEQKYKGCWLMCDNGYQHWSCLMCPIKDPFLRKEMRWSKWLESMRKDVECTFGILKGRFRILKTGIRIHSIKSVDQIWCTCCALHNVFLEHDGLNIDWEQGGKSDWEGELGEFDDDEDEYDHSGMGLGNDITHMGENEDTVDVGDVDIGIQDIQNCREVRHCSYNVFKQRLIEHFDILFKKGLVKWPTRNGTVDFTFE
jgi:Plant transposon protein